MTEKNGNNLLPASSNSDKYFSLTVNFFLDAAGKQFDLAKENKSFDACLGEILRQANLAIKRLNSKNITNNNENNEIDNDE